ncbi:MAG TPA: permease prefix domain 1-containing protein, partial [Candidatus Solibacter sp.]|nr:permease prefix domain 1-containing protein [Candidatus Solibacter sp.]
MNPERRWEILLHRVRSLVRRERIESELDHELRYHVERQIAENIARGMSPENARSAALREFGGVAQVQEECRDRRRIGFIETLRGDVRYGLR